MPTIGNKTREVTNEEFIIHFAKGNTETFDFCCQLKKNYSGQSPIPEGMGLKGDFQG